jgi:WD40 repeat protein
MKSPVMPGVNTIRILICSPGDVVDERERARQVIESLRRRYARRFAIKHLFWEDLPLQPDISFQEGIDRLLSRDGGVDIGVFMLWSRLGSPVGPVIRKPDGSEYLSGTEREFDLMMAAREQASRAAEGKTVHVRPDILVYRRVDENSFHERLRGLPSQEHQEVVHQKELVENFFATEFDSDRGINRRAYHTYERPAGFSGRLRAHLQGLLDQKAEGFAQEAIWDTDTKGPPFMGLAAFEQRHADVFFGREEEVLEARRAFREQARNGCAFLLLCGASGSGKSSFARAGVLPAIIENEIDEQIAAWRTLIVTPFELAPDPVAALVARIADNDVLPEFLGDITASDVVDVFRRDPDAACRLQLTAGFARADQLKGPVRLLLVVDQLEELFASAAISAPDRTAFLTVLEHLAKSRRVWILATVRADFYEQIQNEPSLVRMKSGIGQIDVLPPGADALRHMVEEPAHLAALRFEVGDDGQSLADHILRDAASHAELLPLLEDLLRELYERRTGDLLTFAAYDSLGHSVEGALARRADDVFRTLPAEAKNSLDAVLQALVTLGENAEDLSYTDLGATHAGGEHVVRQRARLSDFPDGSPARQLIDAFVAQRLFTAGRHPETLMPVITVAHESLLRVWPPAADWSERNRDFLHTRAHVALRLKEKGPLLDGDPLLAAARDHLNQNPGGFPEPLRAFVQESVKTAETARRSERALRVRRSRQLYAAGAVAVVALLALIMFLLFKSSLAESAIAGQLVAEAERNMSQRNYTRAEIAAAGALTHWDTPETRQLLVDARGGGVRFLGPTGPTRTEALTVISRDGLVRATVVQSVGRSFAVSVVSTSDQKERWRVELPVSASLPDSIAFSELKNDARELAVAGSSNAGTRFRVDLWHLEQGRPAGRIRELASGESGVGRHSKRIPSIAFHPKSPWIATGGEDRKLCLWDYSSEPPKLLWERADAHGTAVHGIAFNSDGSLLASGGGDYLVKLWDTGRMAQGAEIEPRVLTGHSDSVFAVTFSPDGERLASAGFDRLIRIWDLGRDGGCQPHTVGTLSGHEGTVLALAFSIDGKLLTSGGKDETVRLWDVSEGQLLAVITPGNDEIRSVALPKFEDDLQVGGRKGWSVWSVRGHTMSTRLWNGGATIGAIAFDPTGRYIAAGGNDGKVRVWDRDRSFRSPEVLDTWLDPENSESINGIAFSHDGRWLAAGGSRNVIHIWDRAGGSAKVKAAGERALRHDGEIWGLCFDPEEKWLASSSADQNSTIRLWSLHDWSLMKEMKPQTDAIWSLACAPGGKRIVSGDSKGNVIVRDTERLGSTSETTNVPPGEGERNVWSVAVTESPVTVLSGGSDGRVRRWIPADPAWTGTSQESSAQTSAQDAKVNPTVNSVSYSKKHGWVAAGGDGTSVEIYDRDLHRIRSLKGHSGTIWFVSFDPEGSRLAYGGSGRILRIVDLDEMDRNLSNDTPEQIYRSSQQNTGLSVVGGKIVTGKMPN